MNPPEVDRLREDIRVALDAMFGDSADEMLRDFEAVVVAAAVPVVLNDLADRCGEACGTASSSVRILRAAAEGWGE